MPTYTPLQSIVLTSATSSVTFSGISQNYQDLVLVCNVKATTGADAALASQVNGDTGSTYSSTYVQGVAAGAQSSRASNASNLNIQGGNQAISESVGTFAPYTVQYMNYSNTTTFKTVLARGAGTNQAGAAVSLWRNTAAINSIRLFVAAGSFDSGSTFDLYGVGLNAKATGGLMITDQNYWYHVFTASGSFTTTRALTCDVLSVGGGGGGGWNNAGGGGGGEVDILTGLSIASGVTKTVTIGGGGATATSTSSAGGNGVTTSFASDTTSLGGGGGGTGDASAGLQAGQTGGSGGGGALSSGGGSASGSNTNAGGAGYASGAGGGQYAGGGGGGATSAGGSANLGTTTSGAGGQGYALANIFSGLTLSGITHFGSGGSGGVYNGTRALGGTNAGNGAQEGSSNINPTTPTANAGGGGGGGAYINVNSRQGSAGASGIVIVRYPV